MPRIIHLIFSDCEEEEKTHTGKEDFYPTLQYCSHNPHMRLFCSLLLRMFRKTTLKNSQALRRTVRKGCVVQRKEVQTSSCPSSSSPQRRGANASFTPSRSVYTKGTYAEVAVTSCHPLAMFCFNSWSELIPSLRLISARCFSFAASTWERVWISSSTYEEQGWGENTARAALWVIKGIKANHAQTLSLLSREVVCSLKRRISYVFLAGWNSL